MTTQCCQDDRQTICTDFVKKIWPQCTKNHLRVKTMKYDYRG